MTPEQQLERRAAKRERFKALLRELTNEQQPDFHDLAETIGLPQDFSQE